MASEQFKLRWNNYSNHLSLAFESLRSEHEFTDVTLYCESKKIYAHKMVLSACSGYFRDVLKENPHPCPLIIFKDVKYTDLLAIVQFMYQGEVSVDQELLPSFLQTAEMLRVHGLADANLPDSAGMASGGETSAQSRPMRYSEPPRAGPASKKRKREETTTAAPTDAIVGVGGEMAEDVLGGAFLPANVKMETPEFIDMGDGGEGSGQMDEYGTGDSYDMGPEGHEYPDEDQDDASQTGEEQKRNVKGVTKESPVDAISYLTTEHKDEPVERNDTNSLLLKVLANQKTILQNQGTIISSQRNIHMKMKSISNIGIPTTEIPLIPEFTFPMKTSEEIVEFDQWLQQEENFNKAKLRFKDCFSSNLNTSVTSFMYELLADEITYKYSLEGQRGKERFSAFEKVILLARILCAEFNFNWKDFRERIAINLYNRGKRFLKKSNPSTA